MLAVLFTLGVAVPYTRDGPLRVIADGNRLVRQWELSILPVSGEAADNPGRYIACKAVCKQSAIGVHNRMYFKRMLDRNGKCVAVGLLIPSLARNIHLSDFGWACPPRGSGQVVVRLD